MRTAMSETPIGEYALLSDRHSAALVSQGGSVDWLCFPRFDSPSVFGALLDDAAGRWSIRPLSDYTVSRRYIEPTMVLQTTFDTPTGTLTVTDALATGSADDPHQLGADAPSLLIRSVHCERGSVDVDMRFRPRPEYGLVVPLLSVVAGGVLARGGAETLSLSTPVEPTMCTDEAIVALSMRSGETARFALHRSSLAGPASRIWIQEEISAELATTIAAWADWSKLHQNYDGRWRDLVLHSGRVTPGAELPAHRSNRRRADHLIARAGRRRAQLGLPLRVDPGRQPHHGGAMGRSVPRRGSGVLRLHGHSGRVLPSRGHLADHVRHRR
jgi:GH15 family glucan-1,4-alpha-glucosidase